MMRHRLNLHTNLQALANLAGRGTLLAALGLALSVSAMACANGPTAPSDVATASSATLDLSEDLAFCADEVNRYRASVGRQPLARSAALESFATSAAAHDGTAHVAHQLFVNTGGGGTSMAETEILWWRGYAVRAAIKQGLAQMWKVGPGGEHYDILSGSFGEVGCGVFINNGEVTVAQDFR
jgi:hypothetical protein